MNVFFKVFISFKFVYFLEIDPSKCSVTGRGVQPLGIRVGDVAAFRVHTSGAGVADLDVGVTDGAGVEQLVSVQKVHILYCVYIFSNTICFSFQKSHVELLQLGIC